MIDGFGEKNVNELINFTNEFMYQRYILNGGKIRSFIEEISIPEYIALFCIEAIGEGSAENDKKVYFRELVEKMEMPTQGVSKMVGKLRERGLVIWTHDGIGEEGTYVTITDLGKKLMEEHESASVAYYENVIEKYGEEKFAALIQMIRDLKQVMKREIEEGRE